MRTTLVLALVFHLAACQLVVNKQIEMSSDATLVDSGSNTGSDASVGTDGPADAGIPLDGPIAIDAPHPPIDAPHPIDAPPPPPVDAAPPPECTGAACPDDGNPCTQNLCTNGKCEFPPQPDGLACHDVANGHDGRCHLGACCEGCWNGNSCVTGTSLTVCGGEGQACRDCDDGNFCTDDTCEATSNACLHEPAAKGTPCPGGTCGAETSTCSPAQGQLCGGPGQACCNTATCNSGAACNSETLKCEACGGQDQLCCVTGGIFTCGTTHLACETDTSSGLDFCRCGGLNEPCCDSVTAPCDFPYACGAHGCAQIDP